MIPTAKISGDNREETRTERAVRDLKEAAKRVKAGRAERQREAETEDNKVIEDQPHDLDCILTALGVIDDQLCLDPEADLEAPRTWEEAKDSLDGLRWEQSYREELMSLRDMGVWKLVP